MRFAAALLAVFLSQLVCATGVPERIVIEYNLSENGSLKGAVIERLEQKGRAYAIHSEAVGSGAYALLGSRKRVSQGSVTEEGLRPERFEDKRPGKPAAVVQFDWKQKSLIFENSGKRETIALPLNTHDRLSFLYSFAFHAPSGKGIEYSIADGKHLSRHQYQIAGRKMLATPLGEIETLHLIRKQDDKNTEIWLATGHHLLPVRILITESGGGKLDQVATKISYQ